MVYSYLGAAAIQAADAALVASVEIQGLSRVAIVHNLHGVLSNTVELLNDLAPNEPVLSALRQKRDACRARLDAIRHEFDRTLRKERRARRDVRRTAAFAEALAAWRRCAASTQWGEVVAIYGATASGQKVAWPEGADGERFEIFRVSDSTILEEHDLPGSAVAALDWQLL